MNAGPHSNDDIFRSRRDASLGLVRSLIGRGLELSRELRLASRGVDSHSDPARVSPDLRLWQRDCAGAISELSGGSKAHWLARAFSDAFLVPSTPGTTVTEADTSEIVERLVDVLQKAAASLERLGDENDENAPAPRRFEFVRNGELRPVLEQAYRESRRLLESGAYERALATTCGILEAIVTDALAHGRSGGAAQVAVLSFEERLAAAQRAGLIKGASARLPAVARRYRDGVQSAAVSDQLPQVTEREARMASQVLHVVMRDLNPGR